MSELGEKEYWATVGNHLRILTNSVEWGFYEEQVKNMLDRQINALLSAPHDWRYHQGRIQGIKDAMELPLSLMEKGK